MIARYLSKAFLVLFGVIGGYLGYSLGDTYLSLRYDFIPKYPVYRAMTEILLIIVGAFVGYFLSSRVSRQLIILAENMEELSTTEKLGTIMGVVVGVGLATIVVMPLGGSDTLRLALWLLVALTFGYLGARIFLSMKEDIFLILAPAAAAKAQMQATDGKEEPRQRIKVLDTNVIIDGRIADICKTGFIEGPIYVPGCVLEELHHIADSAEPLKRARGRRGLDILNQLQKDMHLLVRTYDHIPIEVPNGEVDYRLVQLAKKLDGAIITNDFNLNKVAELEGVSVLNVNELANALKPVVLPGEEMNVTLIREGKEMNQGVAYLEDGTMVVVEGGRRHIGETLDVAVTSVLQTVAGKMIFAEVRSAPGGDDDGASVRSGSAGGWQRRKGR